MNKIFIWAPNIMTNTVMGMIGFVSYITLTAYFLTYEKWVQTP